MRKAQDGIVLRDRRERSDREASECGSDQTVFHRILERARLERIRNGERRVPSFFSTLASVIYFARDREVS
jgi:hypothetical protein